jgi:hypothetical protein
MNSARGGIVWMSLLAAAAFAAPPETEGERIKSERAAATARFEAQERDCQTRFVVTSCIDAARKEERATLTRLRHEEIVLDEARRRDAAAQRARATESKAATQAVRASEPASSSLGEGARRASSPPAAGRKRDSALPPAPRGSAPATDRRVIEQQNEAKFEEKARATQAHRESVELRNAQRAAQGKLPAPLPVAPRASAP